MADLVVLAAALAVAVSALSVAVAAFFVYRAARKVHEAAAMVFWDRHIEPQPPGNGPDGDGGESVPDLHLVS